ncbi:hypothetical protein WBP07_12295 [Novosphingobium sp. BL-8A]|uniref:hypothetical protein n=1 Tax=Novosphingobium sp. BL-8A TaxID=3127639 RepID=UPI003756AFBF
MSGNTGPAKVRVLSSGERPHGIPARRRGDIGGPREDEAAAQPVVVAEKDKAQGADASRSLLWIAAATVLFVIGCILGGVLVTVSLLYPGLI